MYRIRTLNPASWRCVSQTLETEGAYLTQCIHQLVLRPQEARDHASLFPAEAFRGVLWKLPQAPRGMMYRIRTPNPTFGGWRCVPGARDRGCREIDILLPDSQRQHRTMHIQKHVLPYRGCTPGGERVHKTASSISTGGLMARDAGCTVDLSMGGVV